MIGLLLSIGILVVQLRLGIVTTSQSDATWKSIWLPYACLLLGFIVLLIVRAPWKIHREVEAKAAKLQDALDDEAARKILPEIRGRAFNFKRDGIHGHSFEHGEYGANADLSFVIELCNYRQVSTNLRSIELDGSGVDKSLAFSNCHALDAPNRFEYGIVCRFAVRGRIYMQRPKPEGEGRWADEIAVSLARLKVSIFDGLGGIHQIEVSPNEQVVF